MNQTPVYSYEYFQERFAISSVLVARAVDLVIVEEESELGYRFRDEVSASAATIDSIQEWVQDTCHVALDDLVENDESTQAIANRYQDLIRPNLPKGQETTPEDRRETLLFKGAVFEPHALLRIASIAARYKGLRIYPEQALPFVVNTLPSMQQDARRDVAPQRIRAAILESTTELGEMHSPEDPADRDMRYKVVKAYVAELTGHTLAAKRFGNLYSIKEDPKTGISIAERPEGFGKIKPQRSDVPPLACPASYRLEVNKDKGFGNGKSALFRLLRASTGKMDKLSIFEESLHTERSEVPDAFARLTDKVLAAGRYL